MIEQLILILSFRSVLNYARGKTLSTPRGQLFSKWNKKMLSVEKIIQKLRKNKGSQADKRHRGWIGALITGILALIAVTVLGFRSWLQSKKLAKLLHERDQAAEDAHQAELDASLEAVQVEDEKASQRARDAQERLLELDTAKEELVREHEKTVQDLEAITSWDDVDRYVGRK